MQGSLGHPALSSQISWAGPGRPTAEGFGGGYRIKKGIK
jgi:hypothetical protein